MTNILQQTVSSPYQIRAELEEMVLKDLLGPAGGPEEIVAEPTVRGRYILGILAPKGQTVLLAEEEDLVDNQTDLLVAVTYGWTDLDLGHAFHETPQGLRYTISEPARREVLGRLLALNHRRYEAEVKVGLPPTPLPASSSIAKTTRKNSKQRTKLRRSNNQGYFLIMQDITCG